MSSNTFTPRRPLARPRPSLNGSINTASSPNLGNSYNSALQLPGHVRPLGLTRKSSLNALTSNSLATIPDASEGYGLSTVLDEESPVVPKMSPFTPSRRPNGHELDVGDVVDVPGSMFGTVKFVGSVEGKKGVFAGVELNEEFSSRGKNNGDVDGVSYFNTLVPGAGIFLPINRATRRSSPSHEGSFPITPTTPSAGSGYRVGSQGNAYTPPTPSLPKFSQSVGPGRAPSPQFKKSRPSLPRPESPLRKPHIAARPSIGTPASKGPARYGSPGPNKFGQSVRGTQDSRDPSKKPAITPKPGTKGAAGPRSASALGNTPMNYSDDETTPIGTARTTDNGSFGSVSSFNTKMRPASRANDDEVDRLKSQLEERDNQLKEQASSLAEMESSLAEVQSLMGGSDSGRHTNRGSMEEKDASHLRASLREKNEKIAMLTAEFDAHRADFRSTIDTLELASTETERVYEKRVDDLLQEVKELSERGDDVDSVVRQLKQLEELVQELEEGLEDARRGEAEARGEVEFLRGEVERTRSELRREREKASDALNGGASSGDTTTKNKEVEQRDDEIRGLKAIIHSLSRDANPDTGSQEHERTPKAQHGSFSENRRSSESTQDRFTRETLEREVKELRAAVEAKSNREEELAREIEKMRRGSAGYSPSQRASGVTVESTGTVTQDRNSVRDSKGTVVSWRDREMARSPETHRRGNTLETMAESDAYSSTAESFCELCETSGHDILTCTNMFGPNGNPPKDQRTVKDLVKEGLGTPKEDFKPAPLSTRKSPLPSPSAPVRIIPNPMESGPVAGKESGIVNMEKWCGVCEREGHDSIDCPFEDAF